MTAVDFEKNRAEYVTRLELLVKNLKAEERWVPQLGTELVADAELGRITLAFGGKRVTAQVSYDFLRDQTLTDATTYLLESAFKNMILEQLRPVIEPELDRLQKGAKAIAGAGQW